MIRGTKKIYEFNRIIKNLQGDSKRPMMRKMTRGIWSISSRKYQPNEGLNDIFDDEEMASNSAGLDEYQLWRSLMNRFIQVKKKKGTKKKLKVEFEVKVNDCPVIEEPLVRLSEEIGRSKSQRKLKRYRRKDLEKDALGVKE